ncbi:MAG: bifunctional non-ous end joining protein LigD [Solirubrobacterales bacterium]|jgi:bifunctional non-homologous end joining protein LigD|nr:bifunctional non-ous end joining protein LigD [Solirubrobacterales bacterium]
MIDYYARIAPVMLEHLRARPITLKRYPHGSEGEFFYEKRCPKHRPPWVKTATVLAGPRAGNIDFCLCEDTPSLVWLAQLATIEIHPSLSLAKKIERPTVIAFDLDPGPPADIVDCCRIGLRVRELFEHFGLECFAKTTGSKGLQVYAPLNTATSYDETKPFAQAVAQLLEKQTPDEVLSKMSKDLRKGKVFVDWSQNHQRKTTVAVYSLRARERPTASTPVSWAEIEKALKRKDPDLLRFEAGEVLERVDKHGDLFEPVLKLKQKLPKLGALDD